MSRKDVCIDMRALDASDHHSLSDFFSSCTVPIDGFFIMTAANVDGTFMNLTGNDFNIVRTATYGVVAALEKAFDLTQLRFCVMLSSVSGVFGNGGQTNYSSYVQS